MRFVRRTDRDWALLLIRIALGVVMMMHGSQKLFGAFGGGGIGGTAGFLGSMGLAPAVLWAWVVALAEFGGGLAVTIGLFTRLAALAIMVDMIVAITKVHIGGGFFLPRGYEYAATLAVIALSLILSGAGRLSLDALIAHRYGWELPGGEGTGKGNDEK